MFLSVIIPTYNPNLIRLNKTLLGLKNQTLSLKNWELIIVDNNSSLDFQNEIDLSWHPNSKIISEKMQGLTFARVKGFYSAKFDFIIMVDDDNILDANYLNHVVSIMHQNPQLGAIGGKSIPLFEDIEPKYLKDFYECLALRNLGEEILIGKWATNYPNYAPIGAGMAIRKTALESYIQKIKTNSNNISDRKGSSLSSGGDNDIVLEILKSGFSVGYFPQLELQHIIPENRTSVKYLSKLNFESSVSWIKLLNSHGILPWKAISKSTLALRYLKTYLKNKAWLNETNYIKWKGTCGIFKGLSEI